MANKPDPTTGGYDPTGGFDPGAMGDPTQMMAAMAPFMAVIVLVCLAVFIFWIYCWWRIFSKAGYSGALSLLNLVGLIPFIGWIVPLGLFIWFAFSDWPALKQANKT